MDYIKAVRDMLRCSWGRSYSTAKEFPPAAGQSKLVMFDPSKCTYVGFTSRGQKYKSACRGSQMFNPKVPKYSALRYVRDLKKIKAAVPKMPSSRSRLAVLPPLLGVASEGSFVPKEAIAGLPVVVTSQESLVSMAALPPANTEAVTGGSDVPATPSCAAGAASVVQPSPGSGKCYCGGDAMGREVMGYCNPDPNDEGLSSEACSGEADSPNRFDDPSGSCGYYCLCGEAMSNPDGSNSNPHISCCVNKGGVALKEGSLVPKEEMTGNVHLPWWLKNSQESLASFAALPPASTDEGSFVPKEAIAGLPVVVTSQESLVSMAALPPANTEADIGGSDVPATLSCAAGAASVVQPSPGSGK